MSQRTSHRRGLSTTHIVLIIVGVVIFLGCFAIALLMIGITLPAIGKARTMAMAAKSTANLRGIERARAARVSEHRVADLESNGVPLELVELDRLVEDGLLTIEIVQSPFDRPPDGQPDYWMMLERPAVTEIDDSGAFIVSYDRVMYAETPHVAACFLDGNCEAMPIDEFESLLTHPVNAGRDFDLPPRQR